MTNLFTSELIQDLDPMTHVFNGHYVISLSNVQEFLANLASWVEGIKQNELYYNVGLVFVVACECIDSIRF